MIKRILIWGILNISILYAQNLFTPLEKSKFTKLTSYKELSEFILEVDTFSNLISSEVIGKSTEGKNIYVIKFSNSNFGTDNSKIKILIFAQQHGNEQSGKEASLLLIKELVKPENQYLFNKIDFALIPQMNPDGSEKNKRTNGNGIDLNRNHLILTEPETIALHKYFDKYLFEVNMDVHEYWPFDEEWKKLGFRKNFDVTIGAVTNINISEKIRKFSYEKYLPYIFNFISSNGYSVFHYLPGGPVGIDYLRYSTFDINDGRQSFGIQNTLSFIQEGINGEDYNIDKIEQRAKSQMIGMLGLLKFSYDNKNKIKKFVTDERQKLIENHVEDKVAIQLEHISDGTRLKLKLFSYNSGEDTTVTIEDFRSKVRTLYNVKRPNGYLIPKELLNLKQWLDNHNLIYSNADLKIFKEIVAYQVDSVGKIDFERDTIINPYISEINVTNQIKMSDYYYIPLNQLKNNMIVIALEPKSMLSLYTYKNYSYLINTNQKFKILRVIK